MDRTEFTLLFWDSLLQGLMERLSEELDDRKTDILQRTVVRLSLEGEPAKMAEFPLWDMRDPLQAIAGRLTEDDPSEDGVVDLVAEYLEPVAVPLAAALSDESAVSELEEYASPIDQEDIQSFQALKAAQELTGVEEEGEGKELEEMDLPLPVDEIEDELEDIGSAPGLEEEVEPLPAPMAEGATEGELFLPGGEAELADMPDLLPGEDELTGLEDVPDEELMQMGQMPAFDEAPEAVTESTGDAPVEVPDPDSDDAAIMAELMNADLSQMSEEEIQRLLASASATDDPELQAAAAEAAAGTPSQEIDVSEDVLANLEEELMGAEAMAKESEARWGRPAEEEGEPEPATAPLASEQSNEEIVRSRMLKISEAVEELSDRPGDRALVHQLIEHFQTITRPITRMGFRTFGSLSDALIGALEFVRDNDIEAPPALANNLRELVMTLAEVVEGRWSKYKTFYWLINKLNSTMRHMEEMVAEREEQRFFGGLRAEEGEEIEDQIARKTEEAEGRQRAQLTDLQEIFIQEANEHVDLLNRNLLLSERHPNDQEIIFALMRSAHSIKGSANISKFPKIADLGHAMEDVMVAIRDNNLSMTPAIIDVMLVSVDRLQAMIAGVEYEQEYDEKSVEDLKGKLKALAEELSTHPDKYKVAAEAVDEQLEKKVGLKVERKPEPTADKRTEAERQANTVRVDYEHLNSLLNQAAELVINRTRLSGQIESLRGLIDGLTHEKKKMRGTEQRLDRTIEEVSVEMSNFLTAEASLSMTSGGNGRGGADANLLSRLSQIRLAMSRLLRINESGLLGDFSEAEFDRFSELDIVWRDLRESVTHIDDMIDNFESVSTNLDQNISRISLIANDLHEQIMRIRMIPVGRIFNRFPRTVRDMSRDMKKKIALVMKGEDTPLDKTIIEDLADPMIHLVRNACDHGIESPSEREEMGKPAEGTIRLEARQEGNQVVIEVRDDGRGIDVEAIKRKAVERGLMTEEQVNRAMDSELVNLIFAPGFSTAKETTGVSGRGVGMDVVKTAITRLKGNVHVSSELGEGTTFTIRLPLTLAISQALLFSASGSRFAIQLSAVDETMMIREDTIMRTMGTEIIKLRDEVLPIVRLNEVLSIGAAEEGTGERPVIVITSSGGRRVGVMVDRLIGREEVVVKNLGSHLKNVRYVSGGTILGDGAVTLILDIEDVIEKVKPIPAGEVAMQMEDIAGPTFDMESYRQTLEGQREKATSAEREEGEPVPAAMTPSAPEPRDAQVDTGQPHILVVDDSISIRRFVGSILENSGYRVTLANDGVDAMERLKGARFDLILTDLEMPRMHGYELIAEVKQNIAYKNIPIIILTGRAGEKHSRKGMELGAAAFLVKPFNEEELLGEISKNLHHSPA